MLRGQGRDAMYWVETARTGYAGRVVAIRSWVCELARQIALDALTIEIDSEPMALIRTSHTVKMTGRAGEETVVLTKEEFLNEYDLFERNAAPRLRAAVERLRIK